MGLGSRRRRGVTAAIAVAASITLAACGAGKKDDDSSASGSGGTSAGGKAITIGLTDPVTALDPAGSYDNGSLTVEANIYQFLLDVPEGGKTPQPDAAQKCSFSTPTEYTCTLKSGLKFANGDPMTAKDVVFSFTRILKINDPNGPASLLGNMAKVAAKGDTTVVFTLKNPNDQTFPFVLGTSAGPIVDSKVFPADKLLADDKVVGSGPYAITSYQKNELVNLTANKNYGGDNKPKTSKITMKYYSDPNNMKQDVQEGSIDIAWRSLTPTDVEALKKDDAVKVLTGAGGELRYIVFNLKTMPGKTDAQKLAVRRAMAYSIDRQDLAENVFQGTFQPAYSMVPQGIKGATEPFKQAYGEKPDTTKAAAALKAAGVSTPVTLDIDYTTDHYGSTSADEYNQIKRQLEATKLFKVSINGTAYTTYRDERVKDSYGIYQLGWFPDFVDADNYLSNFLSETNFVHAHYCDEGKTGRPCDTDKVLPLLTTEATSTGAKKDAALAQIQQKVATGTMPYLPLLSGKQVAVVHGNISGVQDTLDPTYKFRMWLFSKS
ncbi:peptide/nickel transport system substrate-binding protein [Jatrophihabitans endophyticus]|uniref:Peptide/nickel transport system substrate-binding protein n=1 Tax=Jatrophihabitans endophyticus TaxID=1206085 RepID=A0A1M5HZU9_9ACTN|nr:ABC transporter substrate-binding protein [Jatrophihabitans endophyticus]SHG21538.1 peptide/nickel transport system substrate-binding protein [Jatrophihabitans endophyticus]